MLSGTDYIKTIINGLKTWVDKRLRAVNDRVDNLPNPNWNQNDSNALDYIENRPFYKKPGVENLGNTAFVWKSLTNADDEYKVNICVNGSVFRDVVGVVRKGKYSYQTFVDYTCGTATITLDILHMKITVAPADTEWFFCKYGTEVKKIDSQYLSNEPIYLDSPSEEELCRAILGANGSVVVVTSDEYSQTRVFYPCHFKASSGQQVTGIVISESFSGVLQYCIDITPDSSMSISYIPESAGILYYHLSYLNSGSEWHLGRPGLGKITDFKKFELEVRYQTAVLTYGQGFVDDVYFYTNYDQKNSIVEFTGIPKFKDGSITIQTITIDCNTSSIYWNYVGGTRIAICPTKMSAGQLSRCKEVNSKGNPAEWEAVDPEDIVHTVVPTVTTDDNGKVMKVVDGAWAAEEEAGGLSLGLTGISVGQIAVVSAVDSSGKPTAWTAMDVVSGTLVDAACGTLVDQT